MILALYARTYKYVTTSWSDTAIALWPNNPQNSEISILTHGTSIKCALWDNLLPPNQRKTLWTQESKQTFIFFISFQPQHSQLHPPEMTGRNSHYRACQPPGGQLRESGTLPCYQGTWTRGVKHVQLGGQRWKNSSSTTESAPGKLLPLAGLLFLTSLHLITSLSSHFLQHHSLSYLIFPHRPNGIYYSHIHLPPPLPKAEQFKFWAYQRYIPLLMTSLLHQ